MYGSDIYKVMGLPEKLPEMLAGWEGCCQALRMAVSISSPCTSGVRSEWLSGMLGQ